MDTDITARLIYLVLLAVAVAGSLFMSARAQAGTMARNAATWGLIFVGLLAGYALWSDVRSVVVPSRAVVATDGTISARRGDDGHFHLTLKVGGTKVRFLVDTGASDVVLAQDDARRLGIDPEGLRYFGRAATANGTVRTARVTLRDVRLGPVRVDRLGASVSEGEMPGSLLGMAFLDRFARIEIAGDRLILHP